MAKQARRRGDRKRENRQLNSSVVELQGNHITGDVNAMSKRMHDMFGNNYLPAVVYKGNFVPMRVLSEYSYLTSEKHG